MADEIITELWKIKDDLAKEAGYDVHALAALIRARSKKRAVKSAAPPAAKMTGGSEKGKITNRKVTKKKQAS